jgi:hypothetical protein
MKKILYFDFDFFIKKKKFKSLQYCIIKKLNLLLVVSRYLDENLNAKIKTK